MHTKRILLVCYLSVISVTLLFAGQKTTISGKFEGVTGTCWMYLYSDKSNKDSVIAKDGVFLFTMDSIADAGIYFISAPRISKDYMFALFVKNGTQIHFQVNDQLNKFEITGDKLAQEQNEFYQAWENKNAVTERIKKELAGSSDPITRYGLEVQLAKAVDDAARQFCPNWVYTHLQSPFSAAVIRLYISTFNTNGHNKDTLAEKCFAMLDSQAVFNNYESELLKKDFVLQGYDKYANAANRKMAPEFAIKDTAGSPIKLSDFRGRYLLLDFWASWCGPCRKENPFLKNIYNKYKDQGLAMLSISVDEEANAWKKAIKTDKMDWQQGSDLLGIGYGVRNSYQITAVPRFMFIDKDGSVISAFAPAPSDQALQDLIEKYLNIK